MSNLDDEFDITDFVDVKSMTEADLQWCKFWIMANKRVRLSGQHNFEKERIQVNYNWNFELLSKHLKNYGDQDLINYLKYGWPLNMENTEELPHVPDNQKGAKENEAEIEAYIQKELAYGAVIGPFLKNPFGRQARFSPIDTHPKCDSEELCIIMNLSYPFQSSSVNHSISKERYVQNEDMKVCYPTVDSLCDIIRRKSKKGKVKLYKRDLKRVYKQLFNCLGSIMWPGFSFRGLLYFDVTLSMGSRSAAYCCQCKQTQSRTCICRFRI